MGPPFSTFVINLDGSPERLAHIRAELERADIPFVRAPGVRGSDMHASLKPWFFDESGRLASPMKAGEIGCHAAHLSIWQRMVEENISAALVLEDDATFPTTMANLIAAVFAAAPPGWDIVRLSSSPKRTYVPLARLTDGFKLVRYSAVPNNTVGYLISLSGAKKVLCPGIRRHSIDEYLRRPWLSGLDTYGVLPSPVVQGEFGSNIDAFEARAVAVPESPLTKNLRKSDLANLGGRISTNVRALGPSRWLACLVLNWTDRLAKRVLGRTQIHTFARWLGR